MGMFDILRRLVGTDPGKEGGGDPDRRDPRGSPATAQAANWARLEQRLREIAESGQPLVAGRMQTLGLHHVKAQLGGAWPRVVDKAHRFAHRVIERRLAPEDAWAQVGDDGYVLLFARLSRDEAAFKATSIGREITTLLLGEVPGMEDMPIDVAVHEVDPAELEGGIGLPALVAFFDRKKAEQASMVAAPAGEAPAEGDLEVLGFEYLPVWSPASPEIKLYHCIARRGTVDHQEVVHRHPGPAPDAALECTVLRTALADVEAMLGRRRNALVIVPVHWRTLTFQGLRRAYLEILQQAPARARGLVGFGICGIPEGTWQMSLLHHLPALAPFARFLMVHMEPEPNAVDCYRSTGIRTLAFDAAGFDPTEPQRRLQIETFVRRAIHGRFGVYATGVDSEAAATVLRELGVGLLAGPAVAPSVGLPGTPSRTALAAV